MPKRYLRVKVTKEQFSEIYLEVDDADPRLQEFLQESKREQEKAPYVSYLRRSRLPEELHKLVLEEAEELDGLDWSDPPNYSASYYPQEVTEEEAKRYSIAPILKPQSPPEEVTPTYLDEKAEQLRLEFDNCPISDLKRFILLDQIVSQWLEFGRISPEVKAKLLETFKRQDALLQKLFKDKPLTPPYEPPTTIG